MITEFYRVALRKNSLHSYTHTILDWTESKVEILKILKRETGLIVNCTYSRFCDILNKARREGQEIVQIPVGFTKGFFPTEITTMLEIEIQI